MISDATTSYLERTVPFFGDALACVAGLAAAGLHEEYVVYESGGLMSFASGVLADIVVDRSGVAMRRPASRLLRWGGPPLEKVQTLLDELQIDGWRAYGWAAFELAYARDGDLSHIGDQRLLHLIVPRVEVRFEMDRVHLRSDDALMLERVAAIVGSGLIEVEAQPSPIDVRRHGADDYKRRVAHAVREIKAHNFQKVICSRVVPVEVPIDLVRTYVSGRRANSPARSFLIRLGEIEAAGFSPEIVVRVGTDGRVESQPLAGTRALTNDPVTNQRLRTELLTDPKEIYEHALSVQVACEELREVCAPGSVVVEEFMAIRERGSVQHLASRVTGELAPRRGPWEAFAAVFPSVTASGVPKHAAYASIRENESTTRGLYSGAVLTVDVDGAIDAALVLRAVFRERGTTWLQAGAGIIDQSSPDREYEETCEKLDSVALYLVTGNPGTAARPAFQPAGNGRLQDEAVVHMALGQ